ncbi:hypothetical protein FI667_g147, partial [Globisporangium splendens]
MCIQHRQGKELVETVEEKFNALRDEIEQELEDFEKLLALRCLNIGQDHIVTIPPSEILHIILKGKVDDEYVRHALPTVLPIASIADKRELARKMVLAYANASYGDAFNLICWSCLDVSENVTVEAAELLDRITRNDDEMEPPQSEIDNEKGTKRVKTASSVASRALYLFTGLQAIQFLQFIAKAAHFNKAIQHRVQVQLKPYAASFEMFRLASAVSGLDNFEITARLFDACFTATAIYPCTRFWVQYEELFELDLAEKAQSCNPKLEAADNSEAIHAGPPLQQTSENAQTVSIDTRFTTLNSIKTLSTSSILTHLLQRHRNSCPFSTERTADRHDDQWQRNGDGADGAGRDDHGLTVHVVADELGEATHAAALFFASGGGDVHAIFAALSFQGERDAVEDESLVTSKMNYGIIQNRRHDKQKGGGAGGAKELLQDARLREIAKQMGLDAKDFGEEAQSLWQLLDDVAVNDPKAYQNFIHEQLKDEPPVAPPTSASHDQSTGQSNQDAHKTKETNKKDSPSIALPRSEVPSDTRAVPSASNLAIPLVVDKLREIQDFAGGLCVAIDVVFHPWVMQRCEWDGNFKREVTKLAVEWVQHDAKVRLVASAGKFIKSRYKGGVAQGEDGNQKSAEAEDKELTSHTMDTPSTLLKQINLTRKEEDQGDFLIAPTSEKRALSSAPQPVTLAMPNPKPHILKDQVTASDHPNQPREFQTKETKKPLIRVLEPPSSVASAPNTPATRTTVPKKKPTAAKPKSCAIKKGFLNSVKTQLYPTGSNEGKASSPYVNLPSRSKVVDLGEIERQKKQQEQQQREAQNEVLSFLNPSEQKRSAPSSAEVDCGDLEFEQLCMEADPDLKPQREKQQGDMDDTARQLFGNGLDEISKFLTL